MSNLKGNKPSMEFPYEENFPYTETMLLASVYIWIMLLHVHSIYGMLPYKEPI